MTSKQYTHEDIQVLEEIEHIRENSGMYIGDTTHPTHLIFELLDNALDEAQTGHATVIGIQINTKDAIVSVADNGRGIPFQNDTIETISTKLFSGGKFNKGEDKAYGIASGLHGIGIVAVNALSEWLEIEVYRDNKHVSYRFEDAKVVDKKIEDHTSKKPFSTQATFKPDKRFFETLKFNISTIKNRLTLSSVHINALKILFIVDDEKHVINCDLKAFFEQELLDSNSHKNLTKMYGFSHSVKDEKIEIDFCWNLESVKTKSIGSVNLLRVDQGTHINLVLDAFKKVFGEIAEKEKVKIKDSDCLNGLRLFVTASLYKPKYSSQTKEKLSIPRSQLKHLFIPLMDAIRDFFKNEPELKATLISTFVAYRKSLDVKQNIVTTEGDKVTRTTNVLDSKLKDCTTYSVSRSEIFITEGDSAGGSLVKCRDPKYHAILGLKGKILNVAKGNKDFYKNAEIVDIINALGTGVEPEFNIKGLRYGKVIIATDADPDGAHIATLLLTVFMKLTPKLFEAGVIYLAQMPLYGYTIKNQFNPIYTQQELESFRITSQNVHIQRYKGLGEMEPNQLHTCLIDKNTRKLIQIPSPENPDELFNLMNKSDMKRDLVCAKN